MFLSVILNPANYRMLWICRWNQRFRLFINFEKSVIEIFLFLTSCKIVFLISPIHTTFQSVIIKSVDCLLPFSPWDVAVISVVTYHLFASVRDMRTHGHQPFHCGEDLVCLSVPGSGTGAGFGRIDDRPIRLPHPITSENKSQYGVVRRLPLQDYIHLIII